MPITDAMKRAGLEVLQMGLDLDEMVVRMYRAMRDAKQREAIANYRKQYLDESRN